MKPSPKLLWLQGGLYTGIAALTPLTTALSSTTPMTGRYILCLVIGSTIAGATALKAFLSTNFAESPQASPEPVETKIVNTPSDPANVQVAQPHNPYVI